jgi:hypothetical protein
MVGEGARLARQFWRPAEINLYRVSCDGEALSQAREARALPGPEKSAVFFPSLTSSFVKDLGFLRLRGRFLFRLALQESDLLDAR